MLEILHSHVETFGQRRPVLHGLVFNVGIEIGDGWVADSVFYVATVFATAGAVAEELQPPISLVTHLLHDSGNVAVVEIKSLVRVAGIPLNFDGVLVVEFVEGAGIQVFTDIEIAVHNAYIAVVEVIKRRVRQHGHKRQLAFEAPS